MVVVIVDWVGTDGLGSGRTETGLPDDDLPLVERLLGHPQSLLCRSVEGTTGGGTAPQGGEGDVIDVRPLPTPVTLSTTRSVTLVPQVVGPSSIQTGRREVPPRPLPTVCGTRTSLRSHRVVPTVFH